jgi:integrase
LSKFPAVCYLSEKKVAQRDASLPRLNLTKSAIDRLTPLSTDCVYWDVGLPGFGLKVTPKGRKVFIALYRVGGAGSRLRKYTIGPYGRVTLAMARGHAQKIFAAKLDGRDPAEEKKQSRRRLVVDRIDGIIEGYIQERLASRKTRKKLENQLRRDVLPHWASKSVHEIKRRDVIDLVNLASQRNPHAGYRLLKTLKTFFRWCVARAVLDVSPAEGVSTDYRERSRDRVLTDAELAAVIRAARQMSGPFGGLVEFLALTGQRREEVARLAWNEIDDDTKTWCLPASRSKNKKAHIVHLSPQAWAVIERQPRRNEYVFATSGSKHFQTFGKAKPKFDERSGVKSWVLHDLRRTMVSGMARLGIPPHIADKILNHQAGTISGVAAVYQRHEFLQERKKALELWGAHVHSILLGPSLFLVADKEELQLI